MSMLVKLGIESLAAMIKSLAHRHREEFKPDTLQNARCTLLTTGRERTTYARTYLRCITEDVDNALRSPYHSPAHVVGNEFERVIKRRQGRDQFGTEETRVLSWAKFSAVVFGCRNQIAHAADAYVVRRMANALEKGRLDELAPFCYVVRSRRDRETWTNWINAVIDEFQKRSP